MSPPPCSGRRLGVDVGTVRVGVAVSDPDGVLASPVATLRRDRRDDSDLTELARIVTEVEAVEVIVGLPLHLSGQPGSSSKDANAYAAALKERIDPIPVRLVDERLSTVSATRALRAGGMAGRRQRAVVDQAAAVVILQGWLDSRRTSG